ncbi:MAG: type VI secretion system-associated FHA domain protein TagH [Nitrococcus mobilis]|nr:type VI secretion system-associated FHA domain protein TagH [Nitrococcus mobilis]
MQLSLTVIGPEAERLGQDATKSWVDAGGTIGRSENNDWMLPDPKQEISRCHARIRFSGTVFYLEDTSANGVFLNNRGNRLDPFSRYRLQDGEQIFIGDYRIAVAIRDEPAAVAMPASGRTAIGDSEAAPDPLELLGGAVQGEDYDGEHGEPVRRGDSFLQDHFAPPEVRREEPAASEPLPSRDKAPAAGQGAAGIPPDWWKQLPGQEEETLPPESGRASTLGAAPPASSTERPIAPSAGEAGQRGHSRESAPEGALSATRQPPHSGAMPPSQTPEAAEADALKALLAGAGVDSSRITPELAETLGQLLRIAVQGLMDLLRARMEIKNQFRMPMTLIQAQENNPLKFSTNAEDALHNLLVKHNPDYLGPVAAFRASFEDLRHHQMALLAGMRKAFFAMLGHFDPDELERLFDEKRDSRPIIGKVMQRRNWELYRNLFEDIHKDTERYFNRLFGDAFVTAYEKQMEELKVAARGKTPRRDD